MILLDASSARSFDELFDEAASVPIEGWDFAFNRGRTEDQSLPWIYQDLARPLVAEARRVLDIDTGGGEIFGSLEPPTGSVAVEPHAPNVPIATARLGPLGVTVIERAGARLPITDGEFDLVLNRHGYFDAPELCRVLAPGGLLLTQQVAAQNDLEFNEALGLPPKVDPAIPNSLHELTEGLRSVGFQIVDAREASIRTRYLDVGAVIYQLRVVSWQAPGFDPKRHRPQLRRIHDHIVEAGGFEVRSRRFLVRARK
ncbi:methyltransferase domain-containing protein [Microlunatus sp. GCM10028923]|uniref:methyltransferase domain-containing protein n=1 Tax=Microlunatus sp. GCM10028923 TaxID=3273400 RepID=UPI00361B64A5